MTLNEIVNLAVQWGPTVIFILAVFLAFLTGIRRGFRKSTILAINALIAFAIVIVVFIYLVKNPLTDEYVVTYTNIILEKLGQDSIQNLLGASESCNSLKDILSEIIPKSMDLGEGVSTVVKDNGAYLGALVNSAYHLVFAVILSIVYTILVFLFYILYLIFLPEGRYKKKKNKLYVKGVGKPYKKRRLLGGLVGSLRGVVGGLVFLSFFGSLLFIVTGGDGTGENEDVRFGDETIDQYYDIYEAVGEYGNYGVYSFLNKIKDKDNVPYYLYAADLVLSGSYTDSETNVNASIVYRDEFSNYVKFARSTIELLIKYGSNDITPILTGKKELAEGELEAILTDIFAKEGFKEEFNTIIDEFEEETFFINFALSAVDSIARNINDFDFAANLDPQVRDILNIVLTGDDAITVSNILNKEDAKILLNSVITIMADEKNNTEEQSETLKTISYVKKLLPEVGKLSMFNDEQKKTKGNKVLANVYDYVMESLTNSDTEQVSTMTSNKIMKLTNKTVNEIDWMGELVSLLDVGVEALTIYENNYDEENPASGLFHMLDADNPNKDANKTALETIINNLSKSEILGLALSTSFVNDMLVEALSSVVEGIVLPTEVNYVRELNADGSVKTEGEIYSLLKSIEILLENGFGDFYDKLESDGFASESEMINELADMLLNENEGKTALKTLLGSKLLKYTLSQVLTSLELEEFKIAIPKDCQEDNVEQAIKDQGIIIINNDTLESLFKNISIILPENGEEGINVKKILLNKDSFLENEILHASVILFLVKTFDVEDPTVIIPTEYKTTQEELENSYSTNKWIVNKEVSNILDALDAIFNITTSEENFDITNISLDSANINKTTVDKALESDVIHYTLSDIVVDLAQGEDSTIIIPDEAYDDKVIAQSELVQLVSSLALLLEGNEEADININNVSLDNLSVNKNVISHVVNSSIIHYTLSDVIVDLAEGEDSIIVIPEKAYETDNQVLKTTELTGLVSSVALLLEGNKEADIDINNISLDNVSINKTDVSTVVNDSSIIHYTLSDIVVDLSKGEDSTIVVPDKAYETNKQVLKTTELTGLVSSVALLLEGSEEADIDINNISIDDISINKEIVSLAINASSIVHYTISDKAMTSLQGNSISIPSGAKLTNEEVITTTEIESLFGALGIILKDDENAKFKLDNFTIDKVLLSSSKVEKVLSSLIIKRKITDEINSDNGLVLIDDVYETDERLDIKPSEIKKLIYALEVFTNNPNGIDLYAASFDNIVISKEKIEENEGSLESLIFLQQVSDKLFDILENKIPQEACQNEYKITTKDSTKKVALISSEEIEKVVAALQELLGAPLTVDTGFDVDNASVSTAEDGSGNLDEILGSKIVWYMVSETILSNVGSTLKDTLEETKIKNSDGTIKSSPAYYLNADEIELLVKIIGTYDSIDDIYEINVGNSMDFNSFDTGKIDIIKQSNILRYKVSNIIFDNQLSNITVPYQTVDVDVDVVNVDSNGNYSTTSTEKTINNVEFGKFLTSLSMVMGDDDSFDNFNVGLPTDEEDFITVAQSDIMRATITSKMKVTRDSEELDIVVFAESIDLVSYTDFNNNASLPVLTVEEVANTLYVVSNFSSDDSYEFSFEIEDIGALNIVSIDKLLKSSIFRCLLSNLLLEGTAYAKIYHAAQNASDTITIAALANKEIKLKAHEISYGKYGLRYDEADQANSDFILTDTYVMDGSKTKDYIVSRDAALAYFYILQN